MTVRRLKVITRTPDADIPRARGFYQLEEDVLYFPLETGRARAKYFSFLDSEFVSLQLDREGKLIFVEVTLPRRRWQVEPNLVLPEFAVPADMRFLDFRERFGEPDILCDTKRQTIYIKFSDRPAQATYLPAENVMAQIDSDDSLTALWLTGITDDRAGQSISSWRKMLRATTSFLTETTISARM